MAKKIDLEAIIESSDWQPTLQHKYDSAKDMVEDISGQAVRADKTIYNLVRFSQSIHGQVEAYHKRQNLKPVSKYAFVKDTVNTALDVFNHVLEDKVVELQEEMEEDLVLYKDVAVKEYDDGMLTAAKMAASEIAMQDIFYKIGISQDDYVNRGLRMIVKDDVAVGFEFNS